MANDSIHLILPAASLPAEGCELENLSENSVEEGVGETATLLSQLTAMTQLVGEDALVLPSPATSKDDLPSMEAITFSLDDGTTPHVELSESAEESERGTAAYSKALKRYATSCAAAADGTACERFAECLAIAFNEDIEGGIRRVPLLAERDGRVVFYGVWEASEDELQCLAETWSGDAASGWLPVGDDDEVEGRGLRELAFGLATFGMIATTMPGRAAGNSADSSVPRMDWDKIEYQTPMAALQETSASGGVEELKDAETADATVEQDARELIKATVVDLDVILDLTTFESPNSTQDGARIDLAKLAEANSGNTKIIVDVAAQRAYVLIDGQVIGDTPISTARSGKYTPRGTFHITQKKIDKVSTIYHVALPYWMRLDQSAIGLHVGDLPGKPASAGCIRLPKEVAQVLYSHINSGTPVQVVDAWSGAPDWAQSA